MAEYIDRDALKDRLMDELYTKDFRAWEDADQLVDDAPAADVREVVHAHWVKLGEADFQCSKCGFRFTPGDPIEKFPYCRCGADMREESKEV